MWTKVCLLERKREKGFWNEKTLSCFDDSSCTAFLSFAWEAKRESPERMSSNVREDEEATSKLTICVAPLGKPVMSVVIQTVNITAVVSILLAFCFLSSVEVLLKCGTNKTFRVSHGCYALLQGGEHFPA